MKTFKGQNGGSAILGLIIVGLLAAVLYGSLIGTITDNTIGISGTGNITGATATLTDIIPLALAIGLIVALFSLVGFKVATR